MEVLVAHLDDDVVVAILVLVAFEVRVARGVVHRVVLDGLSEACRVVADVPHEQVVVDVHELVVVADPELVVVVDHDELEDEHQVCVLEAVVVVQLRVFFPVVLVDDFDPVDGSLASYEELVPSLASSGWMGGCVVSVSLARSK